MRILCVLIALCCLTTGGCGSKDDPNNPEFQPTAAEKAQADAVTKRIEELRKERPGVPDATLASQASRDVQRGMKR
jgi:hypothetical protein